MAESPNEQKDVEDIFEDCIDTFETNYNPEVTMPTEYVQTWGKLDQSKSSNVTNSQSDSSQPVSHKIQSSNAETGIGDYHQNSHVPLESQIGEDETLDLVVITDGQTAAKNVKDTSASYTKSGNRCTSEQQKGAENISQLAPLTAEQEGTMQDELGQTLDGPVQSESSNGKNGQGDGSQTESQEIHSGKAETDAVDYNQNRHAPAESQQGQPETTPYVLPQMPTEPSTVHFYLFISGEVSINYAEIEDIDGKRSIPLHLIPEENNLWYCTETFPRDPIKFHFKYKYCLQIGGKEFTYRGELKHAMSNCKEQERRIVKHQFQFDVFIFPDNRHREGETIPKAAMWYTKWLLKSVDSSTISPILTSLQDLNFTSAIEDHTEAFVSWILEQVLRGSTTEIQGLYLFIILCRFRNLSPYLIGNKIACDRFLPCFLSCIDSNLVSKLDTKQLKKTAITLVENSSSPGWLTLVAYFHPHLSIKFLLECKNKESLSHEYESDEYKKLVTSLFSNLKMDDHDDHQKLLKYVMKSSPTLVDALDFFQHSKVSEMFANEDKKVDFFVKFLKKAQLKSENQRSLNEKLDQFPGKIRGTIKELFDQPKEKKLGGGMETSESKKNTSQLDPVTEGQENSNPAVTTDDQTTAKIGQGIPTIVTMSGDKSTSQSKENVLFVESIQPLPNILPQTSPEPNTVCFYLLILENDSVDEASIDFNSVKCPLYPVPDEKNLWHCSMKFSSSPIGYSLKYRYILRKNQTDYDINFFWYYKVNILSSPAMERDEKDERTVKHRFHFDVFMFPGNRHCVGETVVRASIWYAKWLLKFVNGSTISPILTYIQNSMQPTKNHTKELVLWISEQASQNSTTHLQRSCLCVILCRLQTLSPHLKGNKTMCNRLLQCFSTCAYPRSLCKSDLERLEKIAIILVENSSSPGWLTLAAYFYSYLGIKFLLDNKDKESLNQKYDSADYRKLVTELFSCLKVGNRDEYKKLLKYVMKSAPTLVDALDLFQRSEISEIFSTEDEKVDCFVKFFKEENSKSKKKKGLWEKLVVFYYMPEKIRIKIYKLLYSTLLDYAKSGDKCEDKNIKVLVHLILSIKQLGMDQFINVLNEFSSFSRHLLPQILDDESFKEAWLEIPSDKKVDICKLWVMNQVVIIKNETKHDNAEMVVLVYQSMEAITQHCSLNLLKAKEVSAHVVEIVFESKDAIFILDAFESIEKLSPVVQECYISHVKKILTPELVKKSSQIFRKCSTTSIGRHLLSCVVDTIDVPEIVNDRETGDDDFLKILDWLDIWISLLNTIGTIDRKKYQNGKEICLRLRKKIEKGDITLDFLKVLDKEKKKVSMLCASALSEQTSAPSFEEKITELMHVVKDCSKKIELLESTINYGKGLWIEVYFHSFNENDSVIETFNNLKKTWRIRKVYEIQDDDKFWGTLIPLLDQAKVLNPWVDSIFFKVVAKTGLQDENKPTIVSDLNSFISFLATETLGTFHAQWTAVLNDPYSCCLATMNTLLGSFQDQDRLDHELKLVKKEFGCNCSRDVKSCIDDFLKYPNVLRQVRQVIKIFNIFKLADCSVEAMTVLSQFLATSENSNDTTLAELHELIEKANKIMASFSGENLDCVIDELSTSATLLDFIEDIVDEDIRFLIDAVEEHSDQFVSESLVSYFIDVHSFLVPLIKERNGKLFNPREFLQKVEESCLLHKDIAKKIEQCSTNINSLLGLYRSIANRGELTKEIIGNCLSKAEYSVSQKDGKSEAKVSYVLQESGKNNIRNYCLSDLHDLRSRALLIVSSQKKFIKDPSTHANESSKDIDFEDFITQVNLLTEIWTLLTKLCSSGYLKYQNFEQKIKTTRGLKTTRDTLKNDLENWENELKIARKKFYFLNYYYSDQICTLYNFLINGITDEVVSLVHFVDRTITLQQLEPHQESLKTLKKSGSNVTPNLLLSTVGEALEKIFKGSYPAPKPMPNDGQSESYKKLEHRVIGGEIFVATLEPKSPLTVNVLLALYASTSKAFPEPYQIVFCSSQTTWEEIHLLLERCFTHSIRRYHERLFCIVNVDLLTNELQFKLVNEIKWNQKCYQNGDYQLALICCGGNHHHVVEQFAQNSHHISGMSDHVLQSSLKSCWPDVKMITSSLPGLGKTEHIKNEVLEKSMNVATFSISGPFKPCKLIKRLKKLKLQNYHCLHLDIGEVGDPLLLDTFLFQLIVIGMVSAGNQFYHLSTTHIYMEIANTLKDSLRESLIISKYFTRVHLEWQNYKNLLVSNDDTSDVQVVCQYLDVFDRGCIESKEVDFSEPNKSKPLSTGRCQELLAKYFSSDSDVTFTALHTFLAFLADQLLKFSKSAYFKIKNLKLMAGHETTCVRKDLCQALLDVSKQFASRTITTSCSREIDCIFQKESAVGLTTTSAQDMVERVTGMIQWEDNNHLVVVFQGLNSQAITAIYREQSLVPPYVRQLLRSQTVGENGKLEDLKNFTQEQLQEKLEKIACTRLVEKKRIEEQAPSYALTPDNILKMVLIILRIRANVPVIIMGETGCGKTSLVRYLANTRGVKFYPFHFHAGISEEEIVAFIKEKECYARDIKEQIWICLDEINTCDHLGLISDIMCHHSLLGRPLSKNLVFLAACNPYKLRSEDNIKTAGLEGKNITDQYSKLVYRVYPLPEAMIDYVWDFGSLGPKDERAYIERMVGDLPEKDMVVDLLVASQTFIRKAEQNSFCVSLRDVNRCIRLIKWFEEMRNKPQKANANTNTCPEHLKEYQRISEEYNEKPMIKSIVLALAHCYLSRLPTAELRKKYRTKMMKKFSINENRMTSNASLDIFAAILRMEEEDYLDRMELPPGTARNAALRENIFVVLVCILNRIPIFVVGKPGCSKSLSIQLIRSNLRGRDSRDPWFQELPKLYVVSYQGSESSTSEGIIKIFEKAHKYKLDNNALPVVLLDEVGLAENSKNNPLKVLHSLLEPSDGKLPGVAVVGISNWSLDAAKMNRAIHLSRPEPSIEDLYETGRSLHYAEDQDSSQYLTEKEFECLAEAYFEYQNQQTHKNFHGLRDYYALIKSLTSCSNLKEVNISLQRNFGGLPGEVTNIQKIFLNKLKKPVVSSSQDNPALKIIPVTELIQANLKDLHARHLMLITSGDSAIGILKQSLVELEKETITIYGSRFEEDLSEEYNYRILSRIILYMEQDCILILKDLESIYGSLYDMLNQNYTVVGNKKNCRVALGPYSNPMCQVHDGFRCIVLIDQHKVDYSDPPFLNRFEKQVLRFSDVLTEDQQHVVMELRCWVQEMSEVEGFETHFKESDLLIGFHEDTLPSLVLLHCADTDSTTEEVSKKCKDELMWIASPDGVLRTQKCKLFQQAQELSDEYFRKPLHQGFTAFIQHVVTNHQKSFFAGDEIGSKTVVMTFSSITDIRQCLQSGNGLECQVERLSAYKSEKLLSERISEFWETARKELLVLQCKTDLDGSHLMLARCIVEEKRNTYKKRVAEKDRQGFKHVCIVIHIQRGAAADSVPWQFNFLSSWKQVFLDVLEAPSVPLNEILGQSAQKLLTSFWPIHRITRNDLLWCFTCIKYTRRQRPVEAVLHIAKNLFNSEAVSNVIERLILQSIEQNVLKQDHKTNSKEKWQVKVAFDRQSLVNSSTLYSALERFVSKLVRNELAKVVFFLEKENAWPPHLVSECNETLILKLENLWCMLIMDSAIFKIEDIPEPLGAESCLLDSASLDLCFPFSQVIYKNFVPELHRYTSDCYDLYMKDVFDMVTADFSALLDRSQRVSIAKAAFISEVKQNLPAKDILEFCTLLHTFVRLHQEQIFHLMRLVECCQSFIPVLLSKTDDVFCSSEKVVFVKSFETDEGIENKSSETDIERQQYDDGSNPRTESKIDETDGSERKLADVVLEFEAVSADVPGTMEEVLGENNEQCEVLESFEDYLVMTCCEEMFPSQEIVDKNGGLDSWITNASLLLSLGFKISGYSPAFHYLRFCVDFSRIICTMDSLCTSLSFLYTLNQIGINLRPEYLDHQQAFKMITSQLIKPLKEQIEDHSTDKKEALQEFSALFYGRCIDTNLDTSSARAIVEQVLSMDKPQLVIMMSPVVLRLLMAEEMQRPGIFIELITNPDVTEESPCLQNIDEVFKDCFVKKMIHHDSYAAVMISDLIQCLLHFENEFRIEDIDSSDCEVLHLARCATRLVSQNSEGDCGLRVLSAVAFLRGFFTMIAKFVAGNPSVLNEESPYIYVMTEVNSLLNNPKLSLQMFFIKQLYEDAGLFDVQKWFRESSSLSSMEELWRGEKMQKKAKFTSVLNCPEYEQAKAAYFTLNGNHESSMQEFLKKCTTSRKHGFALLGILINMVYLERAVRKLGDKEELLVDWFPKEVSSCPRLFRELLLRVIDRRDFHCSQLQLSPESSVKEVEMALLVLHIACVVATGADEDLPIYQYLTNPDKCELSYVLAHFEEEMHSLFEYQSTVKESVCVTCACGSRLALKDQVDKKVCPHCHAVLNGKPSSSTSPEASATLSKSFNGRKSPAWDRCTKQMNPAAYHALRLIVYSSFYAGIALDISSEKSLLTALNRLHGDDFDIDFTSAANFCFENVKSDLSCLMIILSCKESVAIKTMHLVVDKSSDLIRSNDLLSTNDCSTPEMLRQWEAKFSQLTETVFSNARNDEIEEVMGGSQENANTLERRILERDGYPEEPKEQNEQLKRLFRVTKEPSFEDFRSAFLYSPQDVQVGHSFLTLFFAKFDQLLMIHLLHHLLKWSRIVSSSLTLRISRKDAHSKPINDFIVDYHLEIKGSEKERKRLKELFDNFKTAWDEMRDLVNQKLMVKEKEKMPTLTANHCVAYCLTESDVGIYLKTAIEILVTYQNSILDIIISLSSSRQHPVLSFLENKNCSGVPSTSVQNVKEDEIISFQWSDDLFNQHAQNNPEYGKGREITYNFERIEMELVNEIVLGKCYLTGTLNEFIFAKELFHSCSPLLKEIRLLVKQSPDLPKEVLKGLAKLKEQRIKDAQDLLQHIEVLIYLLKRKLKDINVDMTVEELVKEWSTMLPSPFPVNLLPQPKSFIKVEHIAALYEALEDVLADGAVEGLHDQFRAELSGDMKKLVGDMVGKDIIQLKADHLLKVLRRFVFRCLSSGTEKYWPEENAALQSCLQEPSLWVPLQPPDLEEIPQDITVRHIYSVMKRLMELLKPKEGSPSRKIPSQGIKKFGRRRQFNFSLL